MAPTALPATIPATAAMAFRSDLAPWAEYRLENLAALESLTREQRCEQLVLIMCSRSPSGSTYGQVWDLVVDTNRLTWVDTGISDGWKAALDVAWRHCQPLAA
jgi:hypothetical protein